MRGAVCLILAASFILPVFAYASGAPYPVSIYEPYRIKRNLEYIFLDHLNDYYSYLLGDKLNPLTFYMAYRYFQNKPISKNQTADIENIFKNNGNYAGGNDPNYWESEKKYQEGWQKERNAIMQDNFDYGQENNSDDYYYSDNNIVLGSEICSFGTFENATKILLEKNKTLNDEELKTWIKNQDKIFLNCFEPWTSWRDRTWANDKPELICDDLKLQGIKTANENTKSEKRGFFFSWLKSLFGFGKKNTAVIQEAVLSPPQEGYVLPFTSNGSPELKQEEEMQNALYYYYKARKEYQCYNIAKDLFKQVADSDNPHRANATLGYVRTIAADKDNAVDLLGQINKYLLNKGLVSIKEPLLIEKEKLLVSMVDESEFIKAQNGLENPSANFIHDAAIFRQQYKLLVKQGKESLLDSSVLAKHSELVRFLYYWNFEKPDNQWLSRVESEYNTSDMPNMWLALLLREQDLASQKYIEIGLSVSQSSKIYYPVLYYAHRNLMAMDKEKALTSAKAKLSNAMLNTVYDYFSDLVMKNASSLDEAVKYMDRKPTYIQFSDTIDYGYVKSENKTLETLLNEGGWQNEETGATYYYKFINKSIETPVDDGLLTFINFGLPIDRLYSNPALKQEFKENIFTRAFLLGRRDIYIPILNDLGGSDQLLAQAVGISNEKTQDFLIAYAILKNLNNGKEDRYGITIHNENYNYGANSAGSNLDDWNVACNYCHDDYIYDRDKDKTEKQLFLENENTKLFNKYLSDQEIAENLKEKDKLFYDSLVKMLGEPVLAYMELNPKDGRIPEALSLIINRLVYWHGRYYPDHDWTQKVFQTLHYKYPNSSWAKDTPVHW